MTYVTMKKSNTKDFKGRLRKYTDNTLIFLFAFGQN